MEPRPDPSVTSPVTTPPTPDVARLLVRCPDGPGIVAAVSGLLHEYGANIAQSDQYSTSIAGGTFLMRVVFLLPDLEQRRASFEADFQARVAEQYGMDPGGDIFIHGRGPQGNNLFPRQRDWTAGCIAVTDEEIQEIYAMLMPGTPVVIYP